MFIVRGGLGVCIVAALLFSSFLFPSLPVFAQEPSSIVQYQSREVVGTVETARGEVTEEGIQQMHLTVEGDDGTTYEVDTAQSFTEGVHYRIAPGDRVILQVIDNLDGTMTAYLSDTVRTNGLLAVCIIFAAIIIAVGARRGVFALFGFAVTLVVLFAVVFPRILSGHDAVVTAVIAGIIILAVNLTLSHGFTRNTLIALGSTSTGVILAWLLGALFVSLAKLSGLSSEESVFLYWQVGAGNTPVGLLLAGVILGTVGVLDDVAITQCETVAELKSANPSLRMRELFLRAMRVGRHHIASTVNTLVLAYAGASLPLFLIFLSDRSVSFWRFINTEAVAEEVARTLAGTSALVLIVPLTTLIAAATWGRVPKSKARSAHDIHAS